MKKMMLVMIAAVMAVGFSAFTPEKKVKTDYYYLDGATWVTVTSVCPSGTVKQCEMYINGANRLIYTQQSTSFPYNRN